MVGEAGVGKSAVVEGLALRIVQDDVPEFLQGVRLLSLDLGLLQAGASVKGEFEKRLQGVIDEVKGSPTPIVLFIDEAHTMIGAGGQAGGSDAANLLKPALARGELRTIAATTWSEYKKFFEKDPALSRRFQLVHLEEPDDEIATLILRGLRGAYEESHGVMILDGQWRRRPRWPAVTSLAASTPTRASTCSTPPRRESRSPSTQSPRGWTTWNARWLHSSVRSAPANGIAIEALPQTGND